MLNTFFYLIFLSLILFIFTKNLLSLGLILILQTIFLTMFFGLMSNNFWFLYLLILVFIGGMLVLFMYTTSILPNKKFYFNQKLTFAILLISLFLFLLFSLINHFFFINLYLLEDTNFNLSMLNNLKSLQTMKIFSSQTNILLIFLVNYLFYCMIVVIKITNFFHGPLRKM